MNLKRLAALLLVIVTSLPLLSRSARRHVHHQVALEGAKGGPTSGIVCPFLAGMANYLNLTSDEDFQMSEKETHVWMEKFGLSSSTVRDIASSALRAANIGTGKIDIRRLPENGISHMHSTAIRFPLHARIGPNRSQYERFMSHVKEDNQGCISSGSLGSAISKVVEERVPLEFSSKDTKVPIFTWAALTLSFSDRTGWFGSLCTRVDQIKSLWIDGKFPKSPEQVQSWGLTDLTTTVASMYLR